MAAAVLILVALLNLAVGWVCWLFRSEQPLTHRAFLWFAASISAWACFHGITYCFNDPEWIVRFIQLTLVAVLVFPTTFVYLVSCFPVQSNPLPRWVVWANAVFMVVMLPVIFSPYHVYDAAKIGLTVSFEHGPTYILQCLYAAGLFFWGIYQLVRKGLAMEGDQKIQVILVWVGSFLSFLFAVTFSIIFPARGCH